MPKVLMIVYEWPPRGGVGMLRPLMFAKYLPAFGWQPFILTPDNASSQVSCDPAMGNLPGVTVVKTGYDEPLGLIGRIKGAMRNILCFPDEHSGWVKYAVNEGLRVIEKEHIDLIFSSSPPETTHVIAKILKQRSKIPWAADLRDPWTAYHHKKRVMPVKWIMGMIDSNTMAFADKIVTVSRSFAEHMSEKYNKNVISVTNGFEEDDIPRAAGRGPRKKLEILYTGKVHKKYQDPEPFFSAVSELLAEGKIKKENISVNFYTFGQNQPDYKALVRSYSLEGVLDIKPPVPYKDCLPKLRDAGLLLLLDWSGDDTVSRGVIPAKIFDYIASGSPIILWTTRDKSDLIDILRDTGCATFCSSKDELKDGIMKAYQAVTSGLSIDQCRDKEKLKAYTRRSITEKLAKVFNGF